MMYIISFYGAVDDISGVCGGVVVLDMIQIVTIPLLIPYCILSTTYLINNYIVKNKQQKPQNIRNNWELSEINKNNYKYHIVFVLDVMYNNVSINFIRVMLWS